MTDTPSVPPRVTPAVDPVSDPAKDPATARAQAAALFAAAARNEHAGPTAQLHCLAAITALGVPAGPVPTATDAVDPDRLIQQALGVLGNLDLDDFCHPDVRTAARHGRRALREPR